MSEQKELEKRQAVSPRVTRAVGYVRGRWFPVQKDLLEHIQEQISDGKYDNNFKKLIGDVSGDFALLTHSITRIGEMLREKGEEVPAAESAFQLIEHAGLDMLCQILEEPSLGLNTHSIKDADKFQISRIQESITSATTAFEISESYGVDPEIARSSAIVRQLGLSLIAWNYPGLYEETICQLKKDESLDVLIAQKLGFSPNLLAIKVLEDSGIPQEISCRMGLVAEVDELFNDGLDTRGTAEILEICKVGEALARVSQGDMYPSAKDDWIYAQKEIESRLGAEGFKMVLENVEEAISGYSDIMPDMLDFALPLEVLSYMDSHDLRLKDANPYLGLSSPSVSRKLSELYRSIEDIKDVESHVRQLVTAVVPEAGYTGGCVFTPDPSLMLLIPQLDFGDMELRKAKAIDYSIVLSEADMVALAFQSEDPIVHYKMSSYGKVVTAIAGVLGHERKVGVLYLEIPDAIVDFLGDQKVIHFKAIRHALTDSLQM